VAGLTIASASATWATFLRLHQVGTLAVDFLTVPTVTFDVLYVLFVLSLERRRILYVNVTAHPHAAWTRQQVIEAVGPDAKVVHLIRDRDSIYGSAFDARLRNLSSPLDRLGRTGTPSKTRFRLTTSVLAGRDSHADRRSKGVVPESRPATVPVGCLTSRCRAYDGEGSSIVAKCLLS
jgi:hypothetical protein